MSNATALTTDGKEQRRLLLFVAGSEANSLAARRNLQRICEAESRCKFEIDVVDVFEDYRRALKHGVLVTPCLILVEPPPPVVIVGTLNDTAKVRNALRLNPE